MESKLKTEKYSSDGNVENDLNVGIFIYGFVLFCFYSERKNNNTLFFKIATENQAKSPNNDNMENNPSTSSGRCVEIKGIMPWTFAEVLKKKNVSYFIFIQ